MGLRKLFAGAAALATLLGGLAAGAATASAEGSASITLSGNTVAGTTYTAYKIADYDTANAQVEGDALKSILVKTTDEWKDDANAALSDEQKASQDYQALNDPVAYAAHNLTATQLSTFVEGLAAKTQGKNVAATQSVAADGAQVRFGNLGEGLYLVVSTVNGTDPVKSAGKALAIIGTQVTVNGQTYQKLGDTELGKADVKPTTEQTPVKSSDKDEHGVTVGDKVTYTVHAVVPDEADSYSLTDAMGAGLTYNSDVKVYVTAADTAEAPASGELTATTDYTVSTPEGATFKVEFTADGLKKVAGKKVWLVYTATVNQDAVTDTLKNTVSTGNDVKTEHSVHTTPFSFKKVGVDSDANGLQGVEFKIEAADTTGNTASIPDGYTTTATSDANGVVSFKGLADGVYKVTETSPKDGYLNTNTSFTVTVSNGAVTLKDADSLKLVNTDSDGAITVKNVKKISQLPLTGAAGVTMFLVLAVALAGVAVVTYTKSRSASRALRA